MRYLTQIEHEDHWDPALALDENPREIRPSIPEADARDVTLRWSQEEAADIQAFWANCRARRAECDQLVLENVRVVLHAVLMNEIDYVQFTARRDQQGWLIRVHFWQGQMLLDNKVIAFSGRDVGKSSSLKWKLEQRATNYPHGSAILAGNEEERVGTLWVALVQTEMRKHWWAKKFVDDSEGASRTRNPFHQHFTTGFKLFGRPASIQTAKKMESPHCWSFFLDEAQEFEKLPWEKVQPAINDFEPGVAHGACHFISGVNSEGRTDTVFVELAFHSKTYEGHTYILPSWNNPRYTLSVHIKYLETYEGSIHSSPFKQMIRGLIGERVRGLVPPTDYTACCLQSRWFFGPGEKRVWKISKGEWDEMGGDAELMFRRLNCLIRWEEQHLHGNDLGPDGERMSLRALSMDYGSTSPSELGIWYRVLNPSPDATEANRWLWVLFARLTIQGVSGQDQAHIVDYLGDYFDLDYFSIDSTASTDVVTQVLTDPRNPNYAEKGYDEKVFPAVSNRWLPVRYELDEPEDKNQAPAGMKWDKVKLTAADGYELEAWALMQNSNVLSSVGVEMLVRDRMLCLPSGDQDLQNETLAVQEVQQQNRQPTYQAVGAFKGMHRFSMLRSFAQWYHMRFVVRDRKRQLVGEESSSYYGPSGVPLLVVGQSEIFSETEYGEERIDWSKIA